MSRPATFNLDSANGTPIYQGETFSLSITAMAGGSEMDLTGYVAKSQIRESYQSIQPALTFSASSGLGPNGVISLSAATALTVSLIVNRPYVWDLVVYNSSSTIPILGGSVQVLPRVTRI